MFGREVEVNEYRSRTRKGKDHRFSWEHLGGSSRDTESVGCSVMF